MYYKGYGVKQNTSEAIKWWTIAAKNGSEVSAHNLSVLQKKQERQNTRQQQVTKNGYTQAEIDAAMAQAELLTGLTAGFIEGLFGPIDFGDSVGGYSVQSRGYSNPPSGTRVCAFCNGDGICKECDGEGRVTKYNYNYNPNTDPDSWKTYIVYCNPCSGSGRCPNCRGTGYTY